MLVSKGKIEYVKDSERAEYKLAAKTCMNAFAVFERSPVKHEMKDAGIIFQCYSFMWSLMKGGKITQATPEFEFDLSQRYSFEAQTQIHHYCRARALQAETLANAENFHQAIDVINSLRTIYDTKMHTKMMCHAYGHDHCATSIALSATWHNDLGNSSEIEEICEYVVQDITPLLNKKDVLGITQVLIAVIRTLKW
eukprot:CAMPEP_0178902620 /NCGR_PEP_ID=MMETSP0786-20121207/4707_1 /TAXON_ID=186022 /ORGANISM="Thalassionema frauenfeldii, Strain CCMP 1798" /LENGTH=195 /DNA_ID=CAMNT_0020573909 /DNA_START=114 /DNA_END=698 /DNA_ORIENTATION=+